MLDFFAWLQYSPLLVEMRGSPWLFPAIAGLHLLGLALLSGAVLIVDLRLLGLGLSRQPVAQLARDVEPWLLAGLLVMLPTGGLLFMCFATKYYYLPSFWVKLGCLCLVLLLTFSVRRRIVMLDDMNASAIQSKLVGSISLSLWAGIVLAGRLIGFP